MNKKLQNKNKFNFVKKLLCVVFLVLFVHGQTLASSALQKSVTINLRNATIKAVLEEVQKQTGLSFVYNQKELSVLPNINIAANNVSVEYILNVVFKGSEFSYQISNNNISIKKNERNSTKPTTQRVKKVGIKGKVLDSSTGKPIAGATLIIEGTRDGAISDENGAFAFTANEGAKVDVSFVGMKSTTYEVTEANDKVIIELKPDAMAVDEVVVTGYGNVKRSSFTGNSVVVKRDELLKVSKTNVIKALQAFDPSFRIKENNQWGSDPNALPEVYIRGESGIGVKDLDKNDLAKSKLANNTNLPTFIMDGFEISVSQLYDLDPNRIESVTILKDAAATALYGSRAANGVIIITTVAPKSGKLNVSYSFVGDIVTPDLSDYNLANAAEKLDIEKRVGFYDYVDDADKVVKMNEYYSKMMNIERGVDTYWLSKPLKTAINHKHSLYIDGGSEHLRFGFDLQYANQDGVMRGSIRDRFSAGFYLQYNYKNLQIRNYTSYSLTNSKESPYGNFADYTKQQPYNLYKDENGNLLPELGWGGVEKRLNPLYEASLGSFDESNNDDLINNLSLNWNIVQGLLLKAQLSVTKSSNSSDRFIDPKSVKNGKEMLSVTNFSSGALYVNDGKNLSIDMNAYASYFKTIKNHSINLQAGINIKESSMDGTSATYKGFPSGQFSSVNYARKVDDKPVINEGTTRLVGFLASLNYSLKDIYLFDGSYRLDGSSAFGKNKRFAPFWSVGAGLNIHNYNYFKEIEAISLLKVRASYGKLGKINFPAYTSSRYYEMISDQWYKTGYGSKLKARGNSDLKWETTNTFDAGFEFGMYSNKLYLNFSYYHKKTIDLVNDVTTPSSTGFTTFKNNVGEVLNEGIEINLRASVLDKKDCSLILNANLAHNTNKMLKISKSLEEYNNRVRDQMAAMNNFTDDASKPYMQYEEGRSLSSIWGMKSMGINPSTGEEVFMRPDGTLTDIWSASSQQYLGDAMPKVQGAFSINFTYKNISIYTNFMYEAGGQNYNTTLSDKVEGVNVYSNNVDKRVLTDRWIKAGDIAMYKKIDPSRGQTARTRSTSRFVRDYNVLSWNSASISYDFSQKLISKIGFGMLRVEIGANDILHISSVKQERGLSYPFARTVNLSVKASF